MTDASVLRDFTQPDELSDLTLVIGGTPLHVHKQYLAEWSPVWRQMFLEECSSPQDLHEIAMPDKNLQEVTELLHCIYSTQKPISGAWQLIVWQKINKFLCLRQVKKIQFKLLTLPHFHNKGKKINIFSNKLKFQLC